MFRRLLEIAFGVDNSGLKKGLDKAKVDVRRFGQSTTKDLKSAFSPLAKAATLVGLGTALVSVGRKSIQFATAIRDASRETELSTEFIQKFTGAAETKNIAVEQSIDLLQEFTQRVGEARESEGQLNEMMNRYGLSVRDANGQMKDAKTLLMEVSDLMRNASDAAERKFIADQAFGSGGNGMLKLLQGGSVELENMMQRVEDLGGVLEDEMVQRLADANVQLKEFGRTATIVGANVAGFFNDLYLGLTGQGLNEAQRELFKAQDQAAAEAKEKFGIGRTRRSNPEVDQFKATRTQEILNEAARERLKKTAAHREAQTEQQERLERYRSEQGQVQALERLEQSLADLREQRRMKELTTAEKILAIEEKKAHILARQSATAEERLMQQIEAAKLDLQLADLQSGLEKDSAKTAKTSAAPDFAVSSLARVGGGGLIGPSGSGAGALLSENKRQSQLLEAIRNQLRHPPQSQTILMK